METRIDALISSLPQDCGGMIICDPINIKYFSNADITDGYLVVRSDCSVLLSDSRYIEAAKKEADEGITVTLFTELCDIAKAVGNISLLAFEDEYVTCAEMHRLKKILPDATLRGASASVNSLRKVKCRSEIDKIVCAQKIAERAFDHILGFITPEKTEKEIALELEFYMRKNGAQRTSFDTIAVSGTASSLPHGVPRDKKLELGFLTMDFGCVYDGYCSDMTRTVVIGKADDEMKRVYDTVLSAQLSAAAAVKPGALCSDIDKIARDIIDAKYPGTFGHALGHGVGMYIHEEPRLSKRYAGTLDCGNVVTVEPGIYIEEKYGVRIEDMLAVTENGAENLTNCDKSLIEIK